MSGVFLCGRCRMPQDGLRWHCAGCGGHHVVTDAACAETGVTRPGVRVLAMAEPEYRVWTHSETHRVSAVVPLRAPAGVPRRGRLRVPGAGLRLPAVRRGGGAGMSAPCSVAGCDKPTNARGLCAVHYQRRYREANKEKVAEQQRRYREANKEKLAEQKRRYYEANKGKVAEQQRRYYEANKEKVAEQQRCPRCNRPGSLRTEGALRWCESCAWEAA